METVLYTLPAHWAVALVNADTSGLDDAEEAALDQFVEYMVSEYGCCHCVSVEEEASFAYSHDASEYGVGGCDVLDCVFSVSP